MKTDPHPLYIYISFLVRQTSPSITQIFFFFFFFFLSTGFRKCQVKLPCQASHLEEVLKA